MTPWSERDMIIEINRDVKWIRASIDEIKKKENEIDVRVRRLENISNSLHCLPLKDSRISAGVGAGAGGFVAILMKIFGG